MNRFILLFFFCCLSLYLKAQESNQNHNYRKFQHEIVQYYVSQQTFPEKPITSETIKVFRSFEKPGKTILSPTTLEIEGRYGKIKLRIFKPKKVEAIFLNIHGGGLIWGSAMSDDSLNDVLARKCNLLVISPEYRLMPDNPIQVPFYECFSVAKWLFSNSRTQFGTDNVFIGGGSAGALLAASTIIYVRDSLKSISTIVGVSLQHGLYDLGQTPSHRNVPNDNWGLNRYFLSELSKQMTGNMSMQEKQNSMVSPLYADLNNLPPAFFLVGKVDAFLDDTYFMESRWRNAGNKTYLAVFPSAGHGFNSLNLEMSRKANELFFKWVKKQLSEVKKKNQLVE